MQSFFNETENCLFRKFWACMSSANIVAEIQFKLLNQRVLNTGDPCTCEYATLLQSFYRGTLIIHWHIAQNV